MDSSFEEAFFDLASSHLGGELDENLLKNLESMSLQALKIFMCHTKI